MIAKERLKELIEQGATIWTFEGRELKLDKDISDLNYKGELVLRYYYDDYFYELNGLFETKEEAEWHKEFGCIKRTERLELPTWEEIKEDFIDRHREYGEYTVMEQHDIIIDIQVMGKCIYIALYSDEHCRWKLTKENYILACRKAKELFLGKDS